VSAAHPGETAPTCYRHPDRETWIRCQRCDRPICPDCMREAAVGFQCPECVKEGARSTRSVRLRFGGAPAVNAYATTLALIAANVVVWLLISANGGFGGRLLEKLSLIPGGNCAAPNGGYYPSLDTPALCSMAGHTWADGVANGSVWQVVTAVFTHVEIWHIGFNMLALFFLGPPLEMLLGRTRYLAVYLVSGIAGSAAVMLFADPVSLTYGASGAIFGLMGALLVIGHRSGAQMQQIWFWLGLNLVVTFTQSGISWQGHLGGLVGGALAAAAIVYAPRERRTPVQAGGLVAILLVSAVLIAVRATTLA